MRQEYNRGERTRAVVIIIMEMKVYSLIYSKFGFVEKAIPLGQRGLMTSSALSLLCTHIRPYPATIFNIHRTFKHCYYYM